MTQTRLIDDPDDWNALVEQHAGGFPQLWEWGEVRASVGWRPLRLAIHDDAGRFLGGAQILMQRQPVVGWCLAHAPRGPFGIKDTADLPIVIGKIKETAAGLGGGTLWLDPPFRAGDPTANELGRLAPAHAADVEPSACWVLDLSEADPWSNVRRKHREWIRRAERANISVEWLDSASTARDASTGLRHFLTAYNEVATRLGIPIQTATYYEALWEQFRKSGHASIAVALRDGVPLGAMLQFVCGPEMTFYQGGQTAAGAKLGVHKLLIWRSIVRARDSGLRRYNMWGASHEGVAHLKAGFGAHEERYIGTRSIPLHRSADVLVRAAILGSLAARRIRSIVHRHWHARQQPLEAGPDCRQRTTDRPWT